MQLFSKNKSTSLPNTENQYLELFVQGNKNSVDLPKNL